MTTSKSKSDPKDEFDGVEDIPVIDSSPEIIEGMEVVRCTGEPEEESTAVAPVEDSGEGYIELRGEAVLEEKEKLLEKYHRTKGSLIQNFSRGTVSAEDGIEILIMELLREADALKGSQLLFATRGNIRDETTVIIKRIEALEKIAKTIHRKQKMVNEEVINLDSPYIRLLVSYITKKIQETFLELGQEQEITQIFFEKFQSLTDNWKKEVKREMLAFKDRKMMGVDEEEDLSDEK
jgi:hypothetical protein